MIPHMNRWSPVHVLRQLKHQGFVFWKRFRFRYTRFRFAVITVVARIYSPLRPYRYRPERYRRSFLNRKPPEIHAESKLPRRVFVIWTGENPLTPNRERNLEQLRSRLGVPVELVTPQNLDEWLAPDHPLHDAYQHLSLVHRSDYLRAYLLHHHGGGYCDIKAPLVSWLSAFDRIEADPDAWLASYQELNASSAVRLAGRLGVDIAMHHRRLVGMGGMLARSHTPFTAEWLREVERRLDYFAPQVQEFPGGVRGDVVGYPVSWTDLLGKIYHPLQLKYLDHVRQDQDLLLDFTEYM